MNSNGFLQERNSSISVSKDDIKVKLEIEYDNMTDADMDNEHLVLVKQERLPEERLMIELEPLNVVQSVKVKVEVPEVYVKTENTTSQCSVCFAQLPDENAYYEHMKIHWTKTNWKLDIQKWKRSTAKVEFDEVHSKYENSPFECTVCFVEVSDVDAYFEHMKIHLEPEGECASDACQSQCEHPPALRTDTRAPHTRSSSPGSSLRTAHSRSSQKPSEDDSSADSALTAVARSPATLATNNEKQVHPTGVADTIHIRRQILTSDDDESHNKPSDTNNEPKHKRSRKAASKQNASLKIARETISSGNWNSQNKDTDSKHLNVPTTSSSVVIKTETVEPPTETVIELYVSKPAQSETECTDNDNIHTMRTHTGEKSYSCTFCDYKSRLNSRLTKHMRTHTGEKPFACSLCDYKSSVRCRLTNHMRTHTGEKPFACGVCDYKCTVSRYLTTHMRVHTGEKPFACNLCDYKCSQRCRLTIHMRTHTGDKPFVCTLCNFKCSQSKILTYHMRIHTSNKTYGCRLCEYKSKVRRYLVQHMRVHSDEKPFACNLCDYKCSQRYALTTHMRTHTGEKPFVCSLCNYKSNNNSNLIKHMGAHTGEKPFTYIY